MNEHHVNHIQTAVRGREAEVAMNLERIDIEPHNVSCSLQTVQSQKTRIRFKVCFDLDVCSSCPHAGSCPTIEQNNCRVCHFTEEMVEMHKRVHAIALLPLEQRKIRPNVEASVKEYTEAFNHKGKLRIRGKLKTMVFAFAMSIGINFGRIFRQLIENPQLYPDFCRLKRLVAGFQTLVISAMDEFTKSLRFLSRKYQRTCLKYLFVNFFADFKGGPF
jgi:hypothetical protein